MKWLTHSITVKLTLAFLLVGLVGLMVVAGLIWRRTQSAFNQFILNREQQSLVANLLLYYQRTGSWDGLAENLGLLVMKDAHPLSPVFEITLSETARFTLIDANKRIVYSYQSDRVGKRSSKKEIDNALTLQVNGQTVGWLVLAPTARDRIRTSAEELFLNSINRAIQFSALFAAGLALLLGGILAFTFTRSLSELTEATQAIARGQLGMQVKVRSKDELGELAMSFNQMSMDLQRATHARRQMTADIAHDLRSPLSVIAGYTEALSDGKLPGSPDVYNILHQETRQLNRLIDDLRTLSLADAGELPLIFQNISPCAIVERAATRHAIAYGDKQVSLETRVDEGLPEVSVDVERIAQVFDNLLVNALRHTPTEGRVTISACQDGGDIVFQVADNGKGMVAEDIPYIFDRFFRGEKSRTQDENNRNIPNVGLGLAIARSIIEAHGGTISAQNLAEGGANFRFGIPLKRGPA